MKPPGSCVLVSSSATQVTGRRKKETRSEKKGEQTPPRHGEKEKNLSTSTPLDWPGILMQYCLVILILHLHNLSQLRGRNAWRPCNARSCSSNARNHPSDILARLRTISSVRRLRTRQAEWISRRTDSKFFVSDSGRKWAGRT